MKDLTNIEIPGEVVDVNDPLKKGRIKVKVTSIYDNIETEDIPFANPYKESFGESFQIPRIGQIVNVRFEEGDWYRPLYTASEHYNVNLQTKLEELNNSDYENFSALLFDNKTQIYKDSSKLVLDYDFNQIITDSSSINLALKDNFSKIKLGTEQADQQAILGNNFMEWMDKLIRVLFNAYLGNAGAPVVPNPDLISVLNQYFALRNTKFLSENVDIVDNGLVDIINRVNIGQDGDKWKSTVKENDLTVSYENTNEPKNIPTDAPPEGTVTVDEDLNDTDFVEEMPSDPVLESNTPLIVQGILRAMNNKNYSIETDPYKMNIVGIRNQYNGDKYSNKFIDKMFLIYKTDFNGDWSYKAFPCSTLPGNSIRIKNKHIKKGVPKKYKGKVISLKKYCSYVRKKGLGIMAPGQYINVYYMSEFLGARAMKTPSLPDGKQYAYRDQNWNSNDITYTYRDEGSRAAMYIHKAYNGNSVSKSVGNWSEGCQVFPSAKVLNQFFDICEKHKNKYENRFNYTLMTSEDVNAAISEIEQANQTGEE